MYEIELVIEKIAFPAYRNLLVSSPLATAITYIYINLIERLLDAAKRSEPINIREIAGLGMRCRSLRTPSYVSAFPTCLKYNSDNCSAHWSMPA